MPHGVGSWPREHARGLALGAVAVVVLILVLVFAPGSPARSGRRCGRRRRSWPTQGWAETQWIRLNAAIDDAVNRYYLRRYDRRAPLEPTPTATPASKAPPTPGSRRRRPQAGVENTARVR